MRIIAKSVLREFWTRHPDTEEALQAWFDETERSVWRSPSQIKQLYGSASILPNNRIVFNIRGNHYRLVVHIHYNTQIVYIRFIGTHVAYDQIDATSI